MCHIRAGSSAEWCQQLGEQQLYVSGNEEGMTLKGLRGTFPFKHAEFTANAQIKLLFLTPKAKFSLLKMSVLLPISPYSLFPALETSTPPGSTFGIPNITVVVANLASSAGSCLQGSCSVSFSGLDDHKLTGRIPRRSWRSGPTLTHHAHL